MTLLGDEEILNRLTGLDGWALDGQRIVRKFEFGDFVDSVRFVDSLVGPAEQMNHHPDVRISWNQVTVEITTHSEGGLTASDFALAGRISELV